MILQTDVMGQIMQYAPNFYTEIRNPKWSNVEKTRIDCEVNFKHVGFEEWTPFTACPLDSAPYSKEIFDRCVAGEFGEVAEPTIVVSQPENTIEIVSQNQIFTGAGAPSLNIGEIPVVNIL
jgi:hypothetical protein